MGKIATDIYTFENLRREGFTYVDKTGILWSLVNMSIGKQFFLARPRRFGKSLLVSTLRSLFEGKCELFAGLAIEPKWDWSRSWPVLHLDMGSCQAETVEMFWEKVGYRLESEARRNGVEYPAGKSASVAFAELIERLAAKSSEGQMVQIEEKGYAAKFASDPRKVFKIGCAFDWDVRNLGKWIVSGDGDEA